MGEDRTYSMSDEIGSFLLYTATATKGIFWCLKNDLLSKDKSVSLRFAFFSVSAISLFRRRRKFRCKTYIDIGEKRGDSGYFILST
jgi:hypothetical protein